MLPWETTTSFKSSENSSFTGNAEMDKEMMSMCGQAMQLYVNICLLKKIKIDKQRIHHSIMLKQR